jgi:hypothetical protein
VSGDERFTAENLTEWADWGPEPPGVEPAKKEKPKPRRTINLPDIAKYQPAA